MPCLRSFHECPYIPVCIFYEILQKLTIFHKTDKNPWNFLGVILCFRSVAMCFVDFCFCFQCFQKMTAKFQFCLDWFENLKFWTWQWWKWKKSISQILNCLSSIFNVFLALFVLTFKRSCKIRKVCIPAFDPCLNHGTLTVGEGSVQLTSSIR